MISARLRTTADDGTFGAGNANAVEVVPADSNRIMAIITAPLANAEIIRIGDADVDVARGTPLSPGETIALETIAGIFVCSEIAGVNTVTITEQLRN